jgi:hypothetical protein
MCSTKSLLAGDGDIIAQIFRDRVSGYDSGAWGWMTAYREGIPVLSRSEFAPLSAFKQNRRKIVPVGARAAQTWRAG